jgi:WhiB family redox-sensing transcriptional regulator
MSTAIARQVCRSCPVRVECLADALAEEAEAAWRYGVRGGLTAGERAALATGGPVPVRVAL